MIQGFTALGFIVLFAIYSDKCLPAVADSVSLFFMKILPALFPFYVAANILIRSPICIKASRGLSPLTKILFGLPGEAGIALFVGAVSGYPAGAKITADLYRDGLVNRQEAYTLSAFTNNCGPLFLIGTVGVGMFNSSKIGFTLWLIHLLSALLTGIIFRTHSSVPSVQGLSPHKKTLRQGLSPHKNFSTVVAESMMAMIPVGASIIFFSALVALLNAMNLIPQGLSPLTGILEITNGISAAAKNPTLTLPVRLGIVSAISSWAGISVHIHVAGILSNAALSCKKYIMGKICQTIISTIISLSFFCFHPVL